MSEGYLNARDAAVFVGYKPGVDAEGRPLPARQDKAIRAFYAFVRRHRVATKHRGRQLLFEKAALDRAVHRSSDAHQDRLEEMEDLGRRHARGERLM